MDETDKQSIERRLAALRERVDSFRTKLEHHGLYDDHQQSTERDLKARMKEVESEISARAVTTDKAQDKVGWLEHEAEKWVVATDFDYKKR